MHEDGQVVTTILELSYLQVSQLTQQYDKITGGVSAEYNGKLCNYDQLGTYLGSKDRSQPEDVWRMPSLCSQSRNCRRHFTRRLCKGFWEDREFQQQGLFGRLGEKNHGQHCAGIPAEEVQFLPHR